MRPRTELPNRQNASYRYDPWGKPIASGTTTTSTTLISSTLAANMASRQVLRYASYAWDAESSLYYCSARYYDPATRQWTTGDPGKADGEESAYQYCGGNPVGRLDSSGLKSTHHSGPWAYHCHINGLVGKGDRQFAVQFGVKWVLDNGHITSLVLEKKRIWSNGFYLTSGTIDPAGPYLDDAHSRWCGKKKGMWSGMVMFGATTIYQAGSSGGSCYWDNDALLSIYNHFPNKFGKTFCSENLATYVTRLFDNSGYEVGRLLWEDGWE